MRSILILRGGALGDFIVTLPALALLRQRWPDARIELVGNPAAAQLALPPPDPAPPGIVPPIDQPTANPPSSAQAPCPAATKTPSGEQSQCHLLDDTPTPVPRGTAEKCHLLDDTQRASPRGELGKCHPLDDTLASDATGEEARVDDGERVEYDLERESGRRCLLDVVHSQHEARWGALYGAELPSALAAWLGSFDLVINFWPDSDGSLARHFPVRKGQTYLSGAAMPAITPAAAHYCQPLQKLGLELQTQATFHRLHPFHRRGIAEVSGPIAIHPGSGSPRKNWPVERWVSLVHWLQAEFGARIFVVIGEAEDAAVQKLARLGSELRNLPLRELAAELGKCRLFLGHDSGISHLAAACGVPCVLLFGPSDPAMWAPPAPKEQIKVVRRGEQLESISVADVQAAIRVTLVDSN